MTSGMLMLETKYSKLSVQWINFIYEVTFGNPVEKQDIFLSFFQKLEQFLLV